MKLLRKTSVEYIKNLKIYVPAKVKRYIQKIKIARSFNHLYGIEYIKQEKHEGSVTCLVKNGEYYLESFIEHYLSKGFKHIFFVDNGSTDNTLKILRKHPNVSVYKSLMPVAKYQSIIKMVIAQKTVKGGWCLDADIDEYFDYPHSNAISLEKFFTYLNTYNYTAVVTQMLDMFSAKPLSYLNEKKSEDIKATYNYFDTSSIIKHDYENNVLVKKFCPKNTISNSNIQIFYGGIRKYLYGLNCLLTKNSLMFMDGKLDLFSHVHFVNNAKLADLSCVLYHFKLTSNSFETALQNREAFKATSNGYRDFLDVISRKPDHFLKNENSVILESVNDLIEKNFLITSQKYESFCLQIHNTASSIVLT